MNSFQFFVLCILSVLSIGCVAYNLSYKEKIALERIKRYTRRQADGDCIFNMCNNTEGYPSEEIKMLVEKKEAFKELFGTVVEPYKNMIANRNSGDEKNMCLSRQIVMIPQKARDIYNEWQTIVNVNEYQQVIQFEACASDAYCEAGKHIRDKVTVCESISITLKMIAFNEKDGVVSKDFPIPSGCVCKYKSD